MSFLESKKGDNAEIRQPRRETLRCFSEEKKQYLIRIADRGNRDELQKLQYPKKETIGPLAEQLEKICSVSLTPLGKNWVAGMFLDSDGQVPCFIVSNSDGVQIM